jgi:hypothetical protein
MRQVKPSPQQKLHIGRQWPAAIDDLNSLPAHPFGPLIEIAIDREVRVFALLAELPACTACR